MRSVPRYEAAIPHIDALHGALARAVATKKERLTPKEIRFLRTFLGYSGADFARKIGVSIPTVSRWEREDAPLGMKPTTERLLRLMVLVGDAVSTYPLEEMASTDPAPNYFRFKANKLGWAA